MVVMNKFPIFCLHERQVFKIRRSLEPDVWQELAGFARTRQRQGVVIR